MKRRVLSAILTLCMLASLLPGMGLTAFAETITTISSVADLEAFRNAVNSGTDYAGQTVTLTENLDLGDIQNWTSIGGDGYEFGGTFDGQGHIIYNLSIDTSKRYCGLFGRLKNAAIQNLGIENANIVSSNNDVAVLAGNDAGGSSIEHCYVTGKAKGEGGSGGILGSTHGMSNPTTIKNSYARVELSHTGTTADVSGISAWNYSNSVKMINCFSACTGEIRPIAGWSDGSAVNSANITSTYFDFTLSPDFQKTGLTELGRTSDDLKKQETFVGWDFSSVWAIDPAVNGGYPYLKGFMPGLGGAPGSISVVVKDEDGNQVTDADVYINYGEKNVSLSHQGEGVYSGTVDTKDGVWDIYVNDEKVGKVSQNGSSAVTENVSVKSDNKKGIFAGRYSYRQVFDCQRSPEQPQEGKQFTVSSFNKPMNAVASTAGSSRVRFTEDDIKGKVFYFKKIDNAQAPFSLYMADDESGTNETEVSVRGNIYGLGAKGFLYISDDDGSGKNLGYFISNEEGYEYGDGFTYTPDITGPITVEEAEDYDAANKDPQDKVLTEINVKTEPAKTEYTEGETFVPEGLTLTLHYDNGETKEVDYTSENAGDFIFVPDLSESLNFANTTVEIEYGGKKANQPITVIAVGAKGIFKGRYSYRQVFDCQRSPIYPVEGQQFRVYEFDEPMNAVQSTNDSQQVRFELSEIQDKMFYFKKSTDSEAPFSLYMTDKEGGTEEISVSVKGKIYGLGSKGFLYISADDGSGNDLGYFISNEEGYEYGDGFTYVPDITGPITVEQAEDYDAANMTPQEKVLTGIEIKTEPIKTEYKEGNYFDPAGLVLTLVYDNDPSKTKEVAYNSENAKDFIFTPALSQSLSTTDAAVAIEYGGKTVNQAITVSTKILSFIEVKTEPAKKTYIEGNKFDPAGLVITLHYDNETSEDIAYAGNESSFAFAPSLSAALTTEDNNVVITYGGKTVNQDITVNAKSEVSIKVSPQTKTYSGKARSFDIEGTELTGFTVAYKVNGAYTETAPINAGTYDVKVTRAGDDEYKAYEKVITGGLVIEKATPPAITFPTASAITYGDALSVSTLTGGSDDGTFAWTNGVAVPTVTNSGYEVTFTPRDTNNYDYTGIIIKQKVVITVNPRPVKILWSGTDNLVYDGTKKTIKASIENIVSGDTALLTLGGTFEATEKGSYKATITEVGNNNYTLENGTNLEKDWSIASGSNEWTTVLSIAGWTYGETANAPQAIAKYGTAVFSYSNAENGTYTETAPQDAGTYWVKATVPGTESYTEISAKKEFSIAKATPNKITFPEASTITYGDTLSASTLTGGSGNGTFSWTNGATVPTVTNNGYEVTFTPSDTNNYDYSDVVLTRKITVTVNKANPDYTVPMGLTSTYGNILLNVTLPNGWTWADNSQSVGNVGNNKFKATYTPVDTANYNTVTNIEVTVAVSKADPAYTIPTGLTATYGDTLSNVTLPNGWTWADSTQSVGNAGNNTFKATYTPADINNYNIVTDVDISVTVNKCPVNIIWSGTENLVYDGTEKTISASVGNLVTGDTVNLTLTGTVKATEKGSYTATVTAVDNSNYTLAGGTNLEKYWTIAETENEWTQALEITGWTYGENATAPQATARYGTVVFSYSESENGEYTENIPQNAGTYWVKAAVTGTENYAEISAKKEFVIAKVAPVIAEAPKAARVRKGYELSKSTISGGVVKGVSDTVLEGSFAWKDGTEVMNETGDFTKTVVFTPTDKNYALVEKEITVTVYRPSSGGSSVTRYTVTFDTQGGSKIISKTVNRNTAVEKPADPIKDGFIFEGWFTDKACTTQYDFTSKVIKNITLYAKWTEDKEEPTKPDEPTDPDENPTPSEEWENPFTDVGENDWFYDNVKNAYISGLMQGTTNTTFGPADEITRGMFVTVLYRMEHEPEAIRSSFIDVADDAYYANAVAWGYANGIVKGISETEYAPDMIITREQMAAMIYRYANFKGEGPAGNWAIHMDYSDIESISGYASEAVIFCTMKQYMVGDAEGTFAPQRSATRAEASAVFVRVFNELKNHIK